MDWIFLYFSPTTSCLRLRVDPACSSLDDRSNIISAGARGPTESSRGTGRLATRSSNCSTCFPRVDTGNVRKERTVVSAFVSLHAYMYVVRSCVFTVPHVSEEGNSAILHKVASYLVFAKTWIRYYRCLLQPFPCAICRVGIAYTHTRHENSPRTT